MESDAYWDVVFPDGSTKIIRHQNDITDEESMSLNFEKTAHGAIRLSIIANLSLNRIEVQCVGHARGKRFFSDTATLFVYSTLRKLIRLAIEQLS